MSPDASPARLGERAPIGWGAALGRGFAVFALVLAIGLVVALAGLASVHSGLSFGSALRLGALYLGPFHHVALVFEGDLSVDLSRLPGSPVPRGASASVQLGVALLTVTGLAVWLLFRAGRASAFGEGALARAATGSRVALGYAPPILLLALIVAFERPVEIGSFVTGGINVSMSSWQALVFPLAIAAAAAGAGGLWSWTGSTDRMVAERVRAALVGGWSMLLMGLGLSYAGLLVAGVVQPDEPVALTTPTTARYFETAFERPGLGAVTLGHQLALVPNEALWTLVPASGACVVARGSERSDVLCYGSFPSGSSGGEVAYGSAPVGYLLFLLVPAAATIFGGRRAALRSAGVSSSMVGIGVLAGLVYAALVAIGCLITSVTLTYAALGPAGVGGHLWIGPDPLWGTITAIAWGVTGGAVGAWSVRLRGSRAGQGAGSPTAR